MKKILALMLSMLMLVSVVAGCTPPSGNATQQPQTGSQTQSAAPQQSQATTTTTTTTAEKKIAVYNIGLPPDTLDPSLGQTTGTINLFQNVNGYLYRQNLNGAWEPELAEGYTVSADGKVWTVKLKSGLKFSNGDDITAEDVVFSWTRALDPNHASEYAFILYYIKGGEAFNGSLAEGAAVGYDQAKAELGLKVVDPLTVEITLENSTPFFEQLLGFGTYAILNKKLIESVEKYGMSVETTSSSGPFMVTEWKKDEYYLVEKNPNYYDKDAVKLDGIKYTLVQSSATELNMFEAGQVDLTFLDMSSADIAAFDAQGKLTKKQLLNTGWIAYNTVKAPFDDVRVRLAMVKAIDQELICATVIGGGTAPADGFTPLSMPSPADPSKPFRTKSSVNTTAQIEEAKQLMKDAGFENGAGFPASKIMFNVNSDLNRAISEAMCAMWKDNLGITIVPEGLESKARNAARQAGDFDLTFQGWGADYADPTTFLDCLISTHYYNYGKYNNPEFDKCLKDAAATLDQTERTALLTKAEETLMADMPIIMYMFTTKSYLNSPRLVDVFCSPMGVFDLKWADIK